MSKSTKDAVNDLLEMCGFYMGIFHSCLERHDKVSADAILRGFLNNLAKLTSKITENADS